MCHRDLPDAITHGVPCDPCLAPIVAALNAGGLVTVASCCGHGGLPPWIALADDSVWVGFPDIEAARAARKVLA